MRIGRPKVSIVLTPAERKESDSLAHRSWSALALVRRAGTVLPCGAGRDNQTVARRLRVSPTSVCKW